MQILVDRKVGTLEIGRVSRIMKIHIPHSLGGSEIVSI